MSSTDTQTQITQLINALGNSFNYEDNLGDYRMARRLADQLVRDHPSGPDAGLALFYSGVVDLLRGDLTQANAQLTQVEATAEEGAPLYLLVFSFLQFCRFEQYNTRLDGAGSDSIEASARWDVNREMQVFFPRLHQLQQQCPDPLSQNLSWYLSNILGVAKNARAVADKLQDPQLRSNYQQVHEGMLRGFENYAQNAATGQRWADVLFPNYLRAGILYRSGEPELAQALLADTLQIAEKVQDYSRQALCWQLKGDWLCAPFSHPLAWDFALADSTNESSILPPFTEAREHRPLSEENQAEARQCFQKAAFLFQQAAAPRGLAFVHLRQAYLIWRGGNIREALQQLGEAEKLFEACDDQRGLQLAHTHCLMVKLSDNQFPGSAIAAAAIGQWGRDTGNLSFTVSLGNLLNRLARHLFLRQGRYEASRLAYQASRRLFESLGAPINATQNLVDLALLQEAVGDLPAAALELDDASSQYQQLAELYPQQYEAGQVVHSLLLQHAVMLAAKGYNIENSRMAPDQMRAFQLRLEKLAAALPEATMDWEQIFQSAMSSGADPIKQADQLEAYRTLSLRNLALSTARQSQVLIPFYRYKNAHRKYEETVALQYWQQAYEALPQLEEDWRYFYEAVLWGAREFYAEAAEAHRHHLALREGSTQGLKFPFGDKSQDAVNLRQQQQRYYLEQAMSMWVKLRQYPEAAAAWQALEKSEGVRWWEIDATPWKFLCDAAEFSEGLGEYEQALRYCEQALQLLEGRRNELSRDELRTALDDDRGAQYLYFLGARLAFRQGDAVRALHYAERGKARGLLDLLEAGATQLNAFAGEPEELQKWREGSAKLAALRGLLGVERRKSQPDVLRLNQLQESLQEETQKFAQLEQQLLRNNPGFFSAVGGQGAILKAEAISRQLEPGQLLIEYYYRDRDLFSWALNAGGIVQSAWLPVDQDDLSRQAVLFHQACRQGDFYQAPAAQLADWLLKPLSAAIEAHHTIYFVPSSRLHLVAFHALPFGDSFLGATHQSSYLPSASTLQYLSRPQLPDEPRLLAIGNPTGDLAAATAEAAAVARLYGQVALLEGQATEMAVRQALGQAQLLHLATHGMLSEEAPLASSLALANGEVLNLYEIMGMQLKAELAVLSACDTGRGVATNGDDVLGLTRGILSAGAKGAVVSLWEVDDLSTSLLMVRFHENLRLGLTPAAALLSAQQFLREIRREAAANRFDALESAAEAETEKKAVRSLRGRRGIPLSELGVEEEGYTHPFYWAPFFYTGKV